MNISFFYSRGTAGYVRGEQIANYLGGKKNPTEGFENDVCVYVKVLPPDNPPKKTYLDVDDSTKAAEYLKTHPELGVISNSDISNKYLSELLNRKDIITIPHAHCNYENFVRPNREVKTVGIIGSKSSFQYPVDKFRDKLKDIGLELSYEEDYWNTYRSTEDKEGRLKVCDFYKTIDIQVAWRPKMFAMPLKNPNKLVNASSFGIPTVSYLDKGFNEWNSYYIQAETIDHMVYECKQLKENANYYRHYANMSLYMAVYYHIEKIARLYKKL